MCFSGVTFSLLIKSILRTRQLSHVNGRTTHTLRRHVQVSFRVSGFDVQRRFRRDLRASHVEQVLTRRLASFHVPRKGLSRFRRHFLGRFPLIFTSVIRGRVAITVFRRVLQRRPRVVVHMERRVYRNGFLFLKGVRLRLRVVNQALIKRRRHRILLRRELSPGRRIQGCNLVNHVMTRVLIAQRSVIRRYHPTAPVSRGRRQIRLRQLIHGLAMAHVFRKLRRTRRATGKFDRRVFVAGSFISHFVNYRDLRHFPIDARWDVSQ